MPNLFKFAFLMILAINVASTARAAPAETTSPSASHLNSIDLYYDFDFYAGQPRYAWVVIWETAHNGEFEEGEFETQQEAESYASFYYNNHIVSVEGAKERVIVTGYHVEYQEVEPIMEYVATYDTLAVAESVADYFEFYGYYTEIDFVSVSQILSR